MTCIVAVQKNGKVYMGGDSGGVDADGLWIEVRDDEKVFKNGPFLMGFAGSFRARDLARYSFKPIPQAKGQSDHEYLVTTFVTGLQKCLLAGGMEHKDNLLDPDSVFLLGYKGQLYKVESDFQIGRLAAGFAAVGCADMAALGALDAMPTKPPALRVRHALETAERLSAGVCGPFHVLSL